MNTTISAIRSLRRAARESKPEALLAFQLKAAGITYEREAQVIPGRRYRFDFCLGWLLVEVNGGVWAKGASGHSSGTGITRDCAKTAEAVSLGFSVMAVTPAHVKSGQALQWIEKALSNPRIQ
jgi:hypothetical protein